MVNNIQINLTMAKELVEIRGKVRKKAHKTKGFSSKNGFLNNNYLYKSKPQKDFSDTKNIIFYDIC